MAGGNRMAAKFDEETIERFRKLPAAEVLDRAKDAVYMTGPVSSEDFRDVYRQLVEEGILTWSQVEQFDR